MKEIADRNRDVRRLLFELATVRRLAGIALEQGVSEISEIEPLASTVREGDGRPYLELFPLRIVFKCRYETFVNFVSELSRAEHFFVIQQVRMEKISIEEPEALNVTAVVASLVFPEREKLDTGRASGEAM